MTDDIQIKAWEVLTCPNGHPMWLVVRPVLRNGYSWNDGPSPTIGLGGVPDVPKCKQGWDCPKCGKRAYSGERPPWVFYVKGEERR